MPRDLLRGMSLVDVVVGIGLMLIVFVALFGALRSALELSILAKAKAVSTELANTQMEYLRSLPYASLGTVGGSPSGSIASETTETVSGAPYVVHTLITYYDDPADGSGGADENSLTRDYKKGKVTVTYNLKGRVGEVTLTSNFAPDGVETP